MARPERFELPTPKFVVWLRVIGGSRIARDAPRTLPANVSGTQLGTFSGLFVVTRPFCSRDFPFCSPLSFEQRGAKCSDLFEKTGAGEGNRTLDIQLGKLSFYH